MTEHLHIVYQDEVGTAIRQGTKTLSECGDVPMVLRSALIAYYDADLLISPPQQAAIDEGVIKKNGRDFLVCAPTNSGKSLIGWLRMFTAAIEGGHRSVYVAPLKALAEEKVQELRAIADHVKAAGGPKIKVSITTGDYQTTGDFLGSPPPDAGEIIVCTPERLEVMLRNPDNIEWARAVETYVLDEFHLLGDRTRGGAMEILITRLLVSCPWSSIIGLSATMGGIEKVVKWLEHTGRKVCVIESEYRYPKLHRVVGYCESKKEFVQQQARDILGSKDRALLIFVATRNDCRRVADGINGDLSGHGAAAFNAGLPLSLRNETVANLKSGNLRVVATTTSLKMGVNFPVTDVIIHDALQRGSTGSFTLPLGDAIQMMGRAGRGNVAGRAILLFNDADQARDYADRFQSGQVEELRPQLVWKPYRRGKKPGGEPENTVDPVNALVLTEVVLRKEVEPAELETFVRHTFSGVCGNIDGNRVRGALDFLLTNKLIKPSEGRDGWLEPRPLGRTVALSGLSPESGAILAGMIWALIRLSKRDSEQGLTRVDYFGRLTSLDLLFLTVATFECRDRWLPPLREKDVSELQTFLESLPPEEKPLFNRWRSEDSSDYPTRRLLATLKVSYDSNVAGAASSQFARIMATAVMLHRHAKGESLHQLAIAHTRGRSIIHEGDLESGLKFSAVWVLNCLSHICDPKKCYDMERLKLRALDLMEDLSCGSELGKLRQLDGIGKRSVESLLSAGIESFDQIRTRPLKSLRESTGIALDKLEIIQGFSRQRTR
jgi:superfamily II DNA/RNA helicase